MRLFNNGLFKWCKDVHLKVFDSLRRPFSLTEVRELFNHQWDDKMSYVGCLLSSVTGMRLGEVRCLKREQILEDTIKVDCSWNVVDGEKSTKSGKIRYVPITKEMRDLLLSISPESGLIFTLDGKKPVKSTTITDKLQKEMEKIGLKYDGKSLSFHSFRHFYNTYLVTNNINGDLIRSVMGHESEEMTDHYCNLCDSEVTLIMVNV